MTTDTSTGRQSSKRRFTLLSKVGQLLLVLGLVVADRRGDPGIAGAVDGVLYGLCIVGLAVLVFWEQHRQAESEDLGLGLLAVHLGVAAMLVAVLAAAAPGLLPGRQLSLFEGWFFYGPAVVLLCSAGFLCHAPLARTFARSRAELDRMLLATLLRAAKSARQHKEPEQR